MFYNYSFNGNTFDSISFYHYINIVLRVVLQIKVKQYTLSLPVTFMQEQSCELTRKMYIVQCVCIVSVYTYNSTHLQYTYTIHCTSSLSIVHTLYIFLANSTHTVHLPCQQYTHCTCIVCVQTVYTYNTCTVCVL